MKDAICVFSGLNCSPNSFAAMLLRCAAQTVQGVLQAFRQCREALAALGDFDVAPAAVGQAKVVKEMAERLALNGNVDVLERGEACPERSRRVGQAEQARFVLLAKN